MKLLVIVLTCLLLGFNCDDDFGVAEDMDDAKVISEEEVKEAEEILYVSPKPTGNAHVADHFDDPAKFRQKWVLSNAKKDGAEDTISKYDGEWGIEPALRESLIGDVGLLLKSKAKHAAISRKLDQPFIFGSKPLVLQYDVTFQNGQDCGGAYLKLLTDSESLNLHQFKASTPYTIMFGPDKCGNDHKLHFIFRHKNPITGEITEKHAKRPSQKIEEVFKDSKPHLFTLILKPDNTFEISVDQKVIHTGNLLEDVDPPVNPPAEIDDPQDSKPEDWDEREKIPDPDAVKPEDWDEDEPLKISDPTATKPEGWLDEEPEMIYDPNAEKPDDWNDEMDGDWEAPLIFNPACEKAPGCGEWQPPQIDNPKYKGKWQRPLISNPNYKGVWKPRRIANPNYFQDLEPFKMASIGGFLSSWAKYTNKHPWLWAVYVVIIGLPLILIFTYCCSSSKEDEEAEDPKKTDAVTPDDPVPAKKSSKSKLDLEAKTEVQQEEQEAEAEAEDEDEEEDEKSQDDEEATEEEDQAEEDGDVKEAKPSADKTSPRRRQIRKDQ